jgi:hypothetical protein
MNKFKVLPIISFDLLVMVMQAGNLLIIFHKLLGGGGRLTDDTSLSLILYIKEGKCARNEQWLLYHSFVKPPVAV